MAGEIHSVEHASCLLKSKFAQQILCWHKFWLEKLWQIYGHSPMFSPANVSLYTVVNKNVTMISHYCIATNGYSN